MPVAKRRHSTPPEKLPKGMQLRGEQDPDEPLTERQKLFVHHFVCNKLTQTAAARQAGFADSGTAAATLMKNPKIQKAIAEEREEFARASAMTKQKVIEGFVEAIDMARIAADPTAMISGWREIGKMCGFYEPTKTEIKVSVEGKHLLNRLNTLSDEELLRLAHEDPSILEGEFNVVEQPRSESTSS